MEFDVHLFADVFENFCSICLEIYGLDTAHFYTAPGLAWQAALKMTGVDLEILTDLDMHLFIERGLRGGVAMISKRFAEANNPYLQHYDDERPKNYLMYLDTNNLYGWAMSQSLPTRGFQWTSDEDIRALDITSIPENGDDGCILSVDLQYPLHLHDQHNDYPLIPESLQIQPWMLSSYQKELLENMGTKHMSATKLVPNLYDKTDYVLHYRNLQQYLSLGMKLVKINNVLAFKQEPWLKSYIDFNTTKRKMAKNNFKKEFYKLINNSVFGKTMENLRKRVNIQLVNERKKLIKLTAKPGLKSFKIFNEDLAAFGLKKVKLNIDRPIYVGFSILDLSKTLMYDFLYNYIKKKYGACAQVFFFGHKTPCVLTSQQRTYIEAWKRTRNRSI